MHDLPLLTTIAAAFTGACVLGLITQKLKLSPIVGYLLAGMAIGPHTPGFVADQHLAHQLHSFLSRLLLHERCDDGNELFWKFVCEVRSIGVVSVGGVGASKQHTATQQ